MRELEKLGAGAFLAVAQGNANDSAAIVRLRYRPTGGSGGKAQAPEFLEDLESETADISQCTPDAGGDHILAATFLNEFVPPEIPWIHVDLSAAKRKGGLAHIPTDITGFGVRYTLQLLLDTEVGAL